MPHVVAGIPCGTWAAYQCDLACMMVGRDIEDRIAKKQRLPAWLQDTSDKHKFRRDGKTAARTLTKGKPIEKRRLPESGIW